MAATLAPTIFEKTSQGAVRLRCLCGMELADGGPACASGLGVLETHAARFEANDFRPERTELADGSANLEWTVGPLRWISRWQTDSKSGVWSRRDTLVNPGKEPVVVTRCLARFSFAPGRYEAYTQASNWGHENQGHWQDLRHGSFSTRCQGGRTTQGGTPYVCLRTKEGEDGIAFHLLPRGNWVIHLHAERSNGGDQLPWVTVELGLADDLLRLTLAPGAQFGLPEVLVQPVPEGRPERAAPALHRYVLANVLKAAPRETPVVYNTWFDVFEHLDVERLRRQLTAAKDLGCEVFTVDAGWYGAQEGDWYRQAGDWREKPHAAFRGRMVEFADEVRAAGLGFGLWMEPERHAADAPIVKQHPEWFREGGAGYRYPDLEQPAAYAYLLGEMSRLIREYKLAWMKVDFNFELGQDAAALSGYYERWYALLDELRAAHPGLFLEGCASGGMRFDLNTLRHFDGHFLSDTVNPFDVLRIAQGALLRLPPGRLGKWAVLRSVGRSLARYGVPIEKAPETVVVPGGAGWDDAFATTVDFATRAALSGQFGISGDIAGLGEASRERMRQAIAFFKKWRAFIANSVAHLLTPVATKEDRRGWVAFQLQSPDGSGPSLVFAHRLSDVVSGRRFRLCELKREGRYRIVGDDGAAPGEPMGGEELMTRGLAVDLPQANRAAVWVVDEEAGR